MLFLQNAGAKVRISEQKTKKYSIFFVFSNESAFTKGKRYEIIMNYELRITNYFVPLHKI